MNLPARNQGMEVWNKFIVEDHFVSEEWISNDVNMSNYLGTQ